MNDGVDGVADAQGMSVITVANSKGGAGKSTLVMVLGSAALSSGVPVVFLDADPQNTLQRWVERSKDAGNWPEGCDGQAVESLDEVFTILNTLEEDGFDGLVFIDTAGIGDETTLALISNSDAVVLPTLISEPSVTTTLQTLALMREYLSQINEEDRPSLKVVRSGIIKKPTVPLKQLFDLVGDEPETVGPSLGQHNALASWRDEGPLFQRFQREVAKGQLSVAHGLHIKRILEEGVAIINAVFDEEETT